MPFLPANFFPERNIDAMPNVDVSGTPDRQQLMRRPRSRSVGSAPLHVDYESEADAASTSDKVKGDGHAQEHTTGQVIMRGKFTYHACLNTRVNSMPGNLVQGVGYVMANQENSSPHLLYILVATVIWCSAVFILSKLLDS
ncbi:hypothetical protein F4811DRAFT_554707 [Daldinia bambusicola]|nr:hypothetical protein F4811DRAFT_554707 [Daldinia bambusicola]